jgi:hypothetical protein
MNIRRRILVFILFFTVFLLVMIALIVNSKAKNDGELNDTFVTINEFKYTNAIYRYAGSLFREWA